MKCSGVKNLLIDYIDNELSQKMGQDIARHLDNCPACRQMEQSLRQNIIQPLRQAKKEEVPERVWYQLKESIINRPQGSFLADLIARWSGYFQIKRPVLVPVTALAMVVLLVSLFLFNSILSTQNTLNAYLAEQADYLLQLAENGKEGYLGIQEFNLGTSIEKYFL
jgi:anti-sigma factor RsiW